MKKRLLYLLFFVFTSSLVAQNTVKINWISFEEAIERNETVPKKFLIDVYTKWCGWCKRLNATTFKNPVIVAYINEYYWPVKLDAERTDTVKLGDQIFVNENTDRRRGAHQLAIALLNGKMSYPSIVYLDENVELLQAVPGYYDAKGIEPIILFFGRDIYKQTSWEDFKAGFVSSLDNLGN